MEYKPLEELNKSFDDALYELLLSKGDIHNHGRRGGISYAVKVLKRDISKEEAIKVLEKAL